MDNDLHKLYVDILTFGWKIAAYALSPGGFVYIRCKHLNFCGDRYYIIRQKG